MPAKTEWDQVVWPSPVDALEGHQELLTPQGSRSPKDSLAGEHVRGQDSKGGCQHKKEDKERQGGE